jgi:hypothetical protein
MKLYLSIISASVIVISLVNTALMHSPWHYVIFITLWCTLLQFAIDGSIAFLINKLPNKYFSVTNPLYRVTKTEKELYKILRVRLWKDKVWELGGLGGFSKKILKEPQNPAYIERFIIECNKGVATHRLSYGAGFLAMLTLSGAAVLTVALPVALVNLFLNILPTLALRYNTPKLHSALKRLSRR